MFGNIHFHVLFLDGVYVLGTDAENAVASRSSLMHEASKSAIPSRLSFLKLSQSAHHITAPEYDFVVVSEGGSAR